MDLPFDEKKMRAKMLEARELRMGFLNAWVGSLMINWANLESLFCYMVADLLKTDLYRAEVIFYSLNTSQARTALIYRLSRVFIRDATTLKKLDRLLARFKRVTAIRNTYAHATYQQDYAEPPDPSRMSGNEIPDRLFKVRFPTDFDGTNHITDMKIDRKSLDLLDRSIATCRKLNDDVRAFLKILPKHVSDSPKEPAYRQFRPY